MTNTNPKQVAANNPSAMTGSLVDQIGIETNEQAAEAIFAELELPVSESHATIIDVLRRLLRESSAALHLDAWLPIATPLAQQTLSYFLLGVAEELAVQLQLRRKTGLAALGYAVVLERFYPTLDETGNSKVIMALGPGNFDYERDPSLLLPFLLGVWGKSSASAWLANGLTTPYPTKAMKDVMGVLDTCTSAPVSNGEARDAMKEAMNALLYGESALDEQTDVKPRSLFSDIFAAEGRNASQDDEQSVEEAIAEHRCLLLSILEGTMTEHEFSDVHLDLDSQFITFKLSDVPCRVEFDSSDVDPFSDCLVVEAKFVLPTKSDREVVLAFKAVNAINKRSRLVKATIKPDEPPRITMTVLLQEPGVHSHVDDSIISLVGLLKTELEYFTFVMRKYGDK